MDSELSSSDEFTVVQNELNGNPYQVSVSEGSSSLYEDFNQPSDGIEDEADDVDPVLITELKNVLGKRLDERFLIYLPNDDVNVTEDRVLDIFADGEWDTDLDSDDYEDDSDPSLKQLYVDICHRLGVTPVSYLANNMETPSINLKYRGVSGGEAEAIAEALKDLLNVEALDLSDNCISGSGCKHLCQVLQANTTVKKLDISFNRFGNSCMAHISTMLARNGSLRKLSLAANHLDDGSADILADLMEDCKVRVLNLSRNSYCDTGGKLIGPAISCNVYMEEIDLSWNQLRLSGAVAIAKGIKENVKLSICNLSWNGFGEEGGIALADALTSNTSLKQLDVSYNRLTLAVALRFAKALMVNETLETLKLSGNPISTAGCLALAEAVLKSKTSPIKFLDLFDDPVEYQFVQATKEVFRIKPDFKVIHGPVLRAGNTTEDVGKPAIDIVRLSQKPFMIIQGQLIINDIDMFKKLLKESGIKSETCSVQQLTQVIGSKAGSVSAKQLSDAMERLPKDGTQSIAIGDVLKHCSYPIRS